MKLLSVKFRKALGIILFYSLARWMPKPHFIIKPIGIFSKRLRGICGKLILDRCGENVNIYNLSSFSTRVKLGDNSDIGYKARITGACTIGNNVIMGPEVYILSMNHRSDSIDIPIKYQGNTEEREVFIDDDSWIGCRVIILPGVRIGKGVIIGAGAVVSKDIPDYSIAVGNPARVVKIRGNCELLRKE